MKKTENNLNFKSKFTLMNTNEFSKNETNILKHENKIILEKTQIKIKNQKSFIFNSSIVNGSYIFTEEKNINANDYQSSQTERSTNSELNKKSYTCNWNNQQFQKKLSNELLFKNNTKNDISEMYVPEKYGAQHNNTFVMAFCQPSIYDYFKWLFGKKSYEYDDYIQYKLYKKCHKEQDIIINTLTVEKNALHCQGFVKKIIVIKDSNHVPKKVIFI